MSFPKTSTTAGRGRVLRNKYGVPFHRGLFPIIDNVNIYVINMKKPGEIEVRYYEDEFGRHPFAKFFKRVKGMAAAKITGAITRLRAGNIGDSKSVGKGVCELRIDWGPG